MPKLTVRLSDEARAGFERSCVAYGISLTALIEAIGQSLGANVDLHTERGDDIIDRARQIDAERRSRKLGP